MRKITNRKPPAPLLAPLATRLPAPGRPVRQSTLRITHYVLRITFLLLLAAAVLSLVAAFAFLEDWAVRGVSWGPDLTPVAQADVQPMGVNVFLDKEVDPASVERTLQMVQDGGY